MNAAMTDSMLNAVLRRAGAAQDGGKAKLPDGRALTLYLAHAGASLSVSSIVATEVDGEWLYALSKKGEQFVVALTDVYAASVKGAGGDTGSRKAGFLS